MNFEKIDCIFTREMCIAVYEYGFWDTVKNFDKRSFIFDLPDVIIKLATHPLIKERNHTPRDYSLLLENVQRIVKYGINDYLDNNNNNKR